MRLPLGPRLAARRDLEAYAYEQAGFFTAAQARAAGYTYQAQKYHVDQGNWDRVDRGVYRLAGWPVTVADPYVHWTLWSGGRAVISHETALTLHDLGTANPTRVHLTIPPAFRPHSRASLALHHADLPARDIEPRDGYQVTTPERTLLDIAASDLTQEQVDASVADALDRTLTTARRLRSRADTFGDRTALRIERALAAEAAA